MLHNNKGTVPNDGEYRTCSKRPKNSATDADAGTFDFIAHDGASI